MNTAPDKLATAEQRFLALDGIRGVCAIIVMASHTRFLTGFDPFPSGYLSVDLFFLMSGLVLAKAYGAKLVHIEYVPQFMRRRFARLLPMWILGLLFGLVLVLIRQTRGATVGISLIEVIAAAVLIPSTTSPYLFSLNPPGWSLFYEMLANLCYGLIAKLLINRVLVFIIVVAASTLTVLSFTHNGLIAGVEWGDAAVGLSRVMFSFFVGIFLSRCRKIVIPRAGMVVVIPLSFATVIGIMAVNPDMTLHWFYDLICVTIVFPFIIWLLISTPTNAWLMMEGLGTLSYPLYAIHTPLILWIANIQVHLPFKTNLLIPFQCFAFIGIIALSYLLGHYVDPAGRRLRRIR